MIDLRSDTLTVPTQSMRDAMYHAEVGDDGRPDSEGRGEDPTVNRLENMAAERLGKEAAVFFPSGTLANYCALLTHCRPGDKVACDLDLHVLLHEQGVFMDRFGGLDVFPYARDSMGMPDLESFERSCSAQGVRMACLENSHNHAGGSCTSIKRHQELAAIARQKRIPVHLDGARMFNAALALNIPVASIAAHADCVMFCLSKGLSAPIGSLLCGSRDFIREARITRKLMGAGMRQSGIAAAAGIIALGECVERLIEDHENAKILERALLQYPQIKVMPVQTNIVMLDVTPSGRSAPWFEQKLRGYNVRAYVMSDAQLRFVTYRGITRQAVEEAAIRFHRFITEQEKEL